MDVRRLELVAVAAVAAIAGWFVWPGDDPPYGPEALNVQASLDVVPVDDRRQPISGSHHSAWAEQRVHVEVTWDEPPEPLDGGRFNIVLIDKRNDTMPSGFDIVGYSPDDPIAIGSHGADNRAADQYPWLRAIGSRRVDGGFTTIGSLVSVHDESITRVEYEVSLPLPAEGEPVEGFMMPPLAIHEADLLLAMVYMGPDHEVYWAERLIG